jgi:hypothetical protein
MDVRTKLGRVAGIAVAAVSLSTLGLAGTASAATGAPVSAVSAPAVAPPLAAGASCWIVTKNGHYLTAVGGGGRTTDVIHTDASGVAGAWERFTLVNGPDAGRFALRTSHGYYLTAVDSGGRTTDTFHSNATRASTWEEFQFTSLGDDYYDIRAYDGHFVTAVNGGGLSSGDTLHTNATHVASWETFQVHCGLQGI